MRERLAQAHYMTHDPVALATKIAKRIERDGSCTVDELRARAVELEIPDGILDNALAKLSRRKTIVTKVKAGVVTYIYKEPAKAPSVLSHLQWVRDNYPRPGEKGIPVFLMPFPEIDMSHLFLKPSEVAEMKSLLKTGRAFVPKPRYVRS